MIFEIPIFTLPFQRALFMNAATSANFMGNLQDAVAMIEKAHCLQRRAPVLKIMPTYQDLHHQHH